MTNPPAFIDLPTKPRKRVLTMAQRAEIIARYDAGDKVKDIAADMGVTTGAIQYHAARGTVLRINKPKGA